MKRFLILSFILAMGIMFSAPIYSAAQVPTPIRSAAILPATCNGGSPYLQSDVIILITGGVGVLELCTAPNTWSVAGLSGYVIGYAPGNILLNPATSFGDVLYEGASGLAVLHGVAGPDGVAQVLCDTSSGGVPLKLTYCVAGVPVDATNPATLTVADRGSLLYWTSGTALALPAISSVTGFAGNFHFQIFNNSANSLVITPNSSASDLCNGAATCTLPPYYGALVAQDSTSAPGHWYMVAFPTVAARTSVETPAASITLVAPRDYGVCTGTCTVTVPLPQAGYEFCVLNDDNVSTAITLSALGGSAMYENTARTAYGAPGSGTLSATAAAGNKVCIVGRDSTHYFTVSYTGTWTAS